MSEEGVPVFTKWRERLWPIHTFELKKIVPLFLMKFFMSFTYQILNGMKDGFVVTAKGSGAEVIPVLKGWIVLPCALAATLLYSKLSNVLNRSTLFYSSILFFMLFVGLYGFVLYPHLDTLSPHQSADWLLEKLGPSNGHWVAIYRNWIQSLFFVITELWAGVAIFLCFWGFVNHISTVNEAKRSYNIFIAGGDIAQMLTGPIIVYYMGKYAASHFNFALGILTSYVLFFGACIMGLHFFLTRYVLTDGRLYKQSEHPVPLEEKTKLSLKESLKFILASKYLRNIAIMVVAYGLTMNLVEVTWKANVKLVYPETGAYQSFIASVNSSVGLCSFLTTTLLSGVLVRLFGWRFSAMIPPIVIGLTSLLFLLSYTNQDLIFPLASFLNYTPLALIVLLGAIQNVSSKVCKYAFFDQTKEMAYIPLDPESKVKGKAAIDVIGSRLGKSGAAWIQIALIQMAGTGSVLSITSSLVIPIACTLFFWILSVRSLGRQFTGKPQAV
jgi:AAA family ATP:ADP antiporter